MSNHKADKAQKLVTELKNAYPQVVPPLNHSNAHELLVATILSAQCTDARVNITTPALFARFPTPQDYSHAQVEEIATLIKSINFYNNKAKNIHKAMTTIVHEYAGQVPDTMDELLTLAGVARKTANVVLSQWFKQNTGIVVDTHVIRLANWFGLSESKDPVKIEQDLMAVVPQSEWGDFSLRLIFLGREVLTARNPKYKGTVWEPLLAIIPGEQI